ncbi:MAG: homocysteine S-methyltransferase family protein [Deltaproteobacteria bacterium]|nr:homocysteine S-methyltransferase family protein [Deltaproteobacteria bacterium]
MAMRILDGAIGTELISRGLELEAPDWSARAIAQAPDLLTQIHTDYARAGATLHTANTFRTQPQAMGAAWTSALGAGVQIARDAVPSGCVVLGSMAPIEDCYRPDRSPGAAARPQHRAVASALANAGCDVLLCDSPTELARIAKDAASTGVERLLVNCIAATQIGPYVDAISALGVPLGVYANAGREDEALGWGATSPRAAEAYAVLAERWRDAGASVIGGCCGTGPQMACGANARAGLRGLHRREAARRS